MVLDFLTNVLKFFKDIKCDTMEDVLKELSIFLMKLGKLEQCKERIQQLIKHNSEATLGFYLLSHLMVQSDSWNDAILMMKILVKLQPNNMEYWILLMMFYEKSGVKCGVSYCEVRINGTKFISDQTDSVGTFLHPKLKTDDDIAKILQQQLNLELMNFVDLTQEFVIRTSKQFQNPFDEFHLNMIELMIKSQFDDAMELMHKMDIHEDNEPTLRIIKGNLLFSTGQKWKGICEYEIAFNLCLKSGEKFPHMPMVRCGDWFLNDMKNLGKARRYFHHCCKSSPTFSSWMGLGQVCYEETNYLDAEKYFCEANKIDKKSGDSWIYLALVNFRLQRHAKFEKCYHIAQKYQVSNSELMEQAEKALDL